MTKRLKEIRVFDIEFLSAEGDYDNGEQYHENPIDYFLNAMNLQAKKLGLINSYFDSPHGLANKENVSCAHDIALLSSYCLN